MVLLSRLQIKHYRCASFAKKFFSKETMKPSRLQEHFIKTHYDKKDKDLLYFQTCEKKLLNQPKLSNLFSTASKQDDDELRTSYISLL